MTPEPSSHTLYHVQSEHITQSLACRILKQIVVSQLVQVSSPVQSDSRIEG